MKSLLRNVLFTAALLPVLSFAQDDLWGDATAEPAPAPAAKPAPAPAPVAQPAPAPAEVAPVQPVVNPIAYFNIAPKFAAGVGNENDLLVLIDDKPKNDSVVYKMGKIAVVPGKHAVQFQHPCYDPVRFEVTLGDGQTAQFDYELKVAKGNLSLKAEKSGVAQTLPVFVNGALVGNTPYQGDVPVCARVQIGGQKQDLPLALKSGQKLEYTHQLPPDPAPKQEAAPADAKPAPEEKPNAFKRFWLGLTVGATYNDFYDTKFGFSGLNSSNSDYELKVDGADDLLGNYWGLGANAGLSGLFMFTPNVGLRLDVLAASRRGDGESDVSVKLYWKDLNRNPEKSDLKMKYYVRQMNIDVPLAFRFVVPGNVYAELGPMASFNLYSKTKFEITDMYGTEEFREHDCFKTFEFAALGGIGVIRNIGSTLLDFNLRFVLGITPLSDADDSPKTWQGQFNISYWFI